jgi:hypothetical protein
MSQELMQIKTNTGDVTPFFTQVTAADYAAMNEKLAAANSQDAKFEDVTPEYWEAKKGDAKVLVFVGWKVVFRTDETTGETKPQPLAKFWDGKREIVMGQMVVVDKMMQVVQGECFRITCTASEKKKAKLFTFEELVIE